MLVVTLLALIVVLIPAYTGGLNMHDGNDAAPYSWPIVGETLYYMAQFLVVLGPYIVIACMVLSTIFSHLNWQKLDERMKMIVLDIFVFTFLVWICPLFAGWGSDWRGIKGWLDG
jgi:hypothetical protein